MGICAYDLMLLQFKKVSNGLRTPRPPRFNTWQ